MGKSNWHDDPYTKKAHKENYEARSVFKLEEIDKRERLLPGAKRILDLGASPGSWTQYCLRHSTDSQIFAIDLNPLNFKDPRVNFHEGSIFDLNLMEWVKEPVDLVLSDMAPKTTGIHLTDVARSLELAELALNAAKTTLKKGGNFVVKVFMGDDFKSFEAAMKETFQNVRLLRPETTRKHSREIYFIGKGKR